MKKTRILSSSILALSCFLTVAALVWSLSIANPSDASAAGCPNPPPGLVSWWPGEGDANDVAGTNNGALMNGASFAPGIVGQAFSFDGVDDFMQVLSPANIPLGNSPRTIMAWIKSFGPNPGDVYQGILGYGTPILGSGQSLFFERRMDARMHLMNLVYGTGIIGQADIEFNKWYFVALTHDGGTTRVYVNAVLDGSDEMTHSTVLDPSTGFLIGSVPPFDPSHANFYGLIDEVAVLDRALSADELFAIYLMKDVCAQPQPCVPPPSGSVSWWPGDGNANDIVGTNNGTMMNGATFADGVVGQAFSFDGVDDYVQIDSPSNIPVGNSPRAITAWIKSSGSTGAHQTIVGYGTYADGQFFSFEFRSATQKLYLTGHYNDLQGNRTLNYDEWYFVALTFDGTALKFYINGELDASASMTFNTLMTSDGLRIGNSTPNDGWHTLFSGVIDEVSVFNRALTAEEIAAIYAAGGAGMCIPLDTTPDPFTFTDQTGVGLMTVVESNTIGVAGINAPAPILITGGEHEINGSGTWTAAAGTVNDGDTVKVRQISSPNFSTTTDAILTIGGVSDTFSVTTLAADTTPDAFTFVDPIDVPLSTVVISNTITVSGINTASPISITGGQYSIGGGDYTSASGTLTNGQGVTVRVMSSANWSTAASATLTIGGVSDTFSVTTIGRPAYTVTGSVPGGHGTVVCDSPVLHGNNSVCTITPATGYHLQSLTDNSVDVTGSVVGHTYTIVNVTSNHDVVGVFTINTYTIATSVPGDHGTLSCASPVNYGANSICTITPEAGYLLKSLTDNGTDVISSVSGNTYTIVNVAANHSVTGAFAHFLVNPKEGTIGTIVEIKGPGFGAKKGKVVLQSGGVTYALKVLEWNVGGSGVIRAQLTKAIVGGALCDVVVYPKEPKGVLPITEMGAFAVKKPEITELSASGGKIGAPIIITGKFSGYKKGKVLLEDKVTHARKSCKVLSWPTTPEAGTGTAEIQFVVPKMALATYNLVLQNKVGEDVFESFTVLP